MQTDTAALDKSDLPAIQVGGGLELGFPTAVLQAVLERYTGLLHPHHGVLTELRQLLVSGLGRLPGYTMDRLPESMIRAKLNLCTQVVNNIDFRNGMSGHQNPKPSSNAQVLTVLDKVDPGLSLGRGLVLFELHSVLVCLANAEFERQHNSSRLLAG